MGRRMIFTPITVLLCVWLLMCAIRARADGPQITLDSDSATLSENPAGTAMLTLSLHNPGPALDQDVSVFLRVEGSASGDGADFVATIPYTVTFRRPASGTSQETFSIRALPDSISEPGETVVVRIVGVEGPATIANAQITVQIQDAHTESGLKIALPTLSPPKMLPATGYTPTIVNFRSADVAIGIGLMAVLLVARLLRRR